jgi:hypothetical protein
MGEFNYITGQYEGYDAYTASGSSSLNWDGLGSTLTGLAQVWGGVEVAKTKNATPLYQYGPNGQLYREGVPVSGMQSASSISPLMLLLIAGAAVFLLKD